MRFRPFREKILILNISTKISEEVRFGGEELRTGVKHHLRAKFFFIQKPKKYHNCKYIIIYNNEVVNDHVNNKFQH